MFVHIYFLLCNLSIITDLFKVRINTGIVPTSDPLIPIFAHIMLFCMNICTGLYVYLCCQEMSNKI